jgi:predicted MFS family arabinose efflux permease
MSIPVQPQPKPIDPRLHGGEGRPSLCEAGDASLPLTPVMEALPPRAEQDAPLLGGAVSAIALAVTMFVEAIGYGVVAPTLPFMAKGLGADSEGIGFLVGLYAAVGLIVSIPFGVLANKYGRRSLILVGLGCLTLSSVGFVLAPTYLWLVAARFAQGAGATAIWVGSLTVAADLTPDESMGRSLSWITGSWSLGFVIGPSLGGLGSVRTPFYIYAALAGVAFVLALIGMPETGRLGTRTTLRGILGVLRRPNVLASAAATLVLSYFYGTIEGFLPVILGERGVPRLAIGLLFTLTGLPPVILPRLVGHAADRMGDGRLIVSGLLFAACLTATALPLLGLMPTWLLFLGIGMVEVLVYVPAVALLNRGLERDERIFATGSHSYAFSAGFFLGPTLGGLLVPLGGYPLMFGTLTVVVLAGVTAFAWASRRMAAAAA